MNPICRLLGHWTRPFRVESPTSITTGAQCRLCGAFLDLHNSYKPEAVARFEAFTRSDYAAQLAGTVNPRTGNFDHIPHDPGMLYGRHTSSGDFLAENARRARDKEPRR